MINQKKILTITSIVALFSCVLANTVSTDEAECPNFCAALYSPVCATDGKIYKEFANECSLRASNCRRVRNAAEPYALTDIAVCRTELVENLSEKLGLAHIDASCLKPCPMIYQPICATNGKYRALVSNQCAMETLNCSLQKSVNANVLRVLELEHCKA